MRLFLIYFAKKGDAMQTSKQKKYKLEKLQIIEVPVEKIKEADYNPRYLSEKAEEDLTKSLEIYGCTEPLILNMFSGREFTLVSGHQRLKILKKLGYKVVPTVSVNLPLEAEVKLNLRMNRNQGEFDINLLRNFELDVLLETGFDESDLSAIWDNNLEIEDDDFDVEQALITHKEPKTKQGDLYQLGQHRLLCGDATSFTDIQRLVGNEKVDMVYTDSPFNIKLDYANGVSTKGKYGATKTNDSKSTEEFRQFLHDAMSNAIAVSKPDAHYFYYMDQNWVWLIQMLYMEFGIKHERVCLWIKNNFSPTSGQSFNKCYEAAIYGVRGKPYRNPKLLNLNEILNKEVGSGNRLHDDILDLMEIWLVKRKAGQDYIHPTEKLPSLHEKALRRCTKPGDLVLDTFGGSGSTLIACDQLNRKAYLCEIDQIFCDVIIDRYTKLTGKEAILCK